LDDSFTDDIEIANTLGRAYISELHMILPRRDKVTGKLYFAPDMQWRSGTLVSVLGVIDLKKGGKLDRDVFTDKDYSTSQYSHDEIEQFYDMHVSQVGLYDRVAIYRSFVYDMENHIFDSPSLLTLGRYGLPKVMRGRFRRILTDDEYWAKTYTIYDYEKPLEPPDEQVLSDSGYERLLFYRYRARHMTWDVHYDSLRRETEHRNASGVSLINRRPIWNPKPLVPLPLNFFDRELLIDRLVMTYLYTVYIDRPDPSKLVKIRKPFWFRDEAQERIEKKIREILRKAQEGGEDEEETETAYEKKEREIEEAMEEIYKPFPMVRRIISPHRKLLWPGMYKERKDRMVDEFFAAFPLETLSRYEALVDDQLYASSKSKMVDSFMNRQLANIYNTIYRWALKHRVMLFEMVNVLLQQGVLWPEQLRTFGSPGGVERLAAFKPPERTYQTYLDKRSLTVRQWFWKFTRSYFAGAGDPNNVVCRHPRALDIFDYEKFIKAETRFLKHFKDLEESDDMKEADDFTYDYEDPYYLSK